MNTFQIDLREWRAQGLSFTEDDFTVELTDGRNVSVPLAWFPRLFHALSSAPTPAERVNWRWIGGGIGIHWPGQRSPLRRHRRRRPAPRPPQWRESGVIAPLARRSAASVLKSPPANKKRPEQIPHSVQVYD